MKFSEDTIRLLKNFASINQSIEFVPGNVIRTMNPNKTIFGRANITETIPRNACIYDLKKFLAVLDLFDEPDVEFGENQFTISQNSREVKYTYTNKSMIITPPDKDVTLPSVDVKVELAWNDLESVLKAASVLQIQEIAFQGDGEKVYLRSIDTETGNKDTYGVEIGDTENTFRLVLLRDNLKMIESDYLVELFAGGVSKFSSENVTYFVAIESKQSSFQ